MTRLIFAASILALTCAASGPAAALSASECSVKYQAAKKDGSLGATKWNDFRKAQCGADAQPAAATTAAPAAPTAAPAAAPKEAAKPAPTQTAAKPEPAAKPATPSTPAASGSAVFPSKIDPKYASESAGKQRQKTCLDQYNVNKANGGNGGLNWIMKGGGYYSECNKRLKV